jgi:hypothetical protein
LAHRPPAHERRGKGDGIAAKPLIETVDCRHQSVSAPLLGQLLMGKEVGLPVR